MVAWVVVTEEVDAKQIFVCFPTPYLLLVIPSQIIDHLGIERRIQDI